MQIVYQEIDKDLLEKIGVKYGEMAKKHIHVESGSYSLAAVIDDMPIGFISTYTRKLNSPIGEEKDFYIDIIEVDERYRRFGVASEMILRTEEWAKQKGLLQIRAWSSQDKVEAISMWRSLGYGLCPAIIWLDWCKEVIDGYYVVKQLNPVNPYPNITKRINQDLENVSAKPIRNFRIIRAKDGVYVYKCTYDGVPAVVKHFYKSEDDEREIKNYHILNEHRIPTIKILVYGKTTLVMEDITQSEHWRLGIAEDFNDVDVAKSLAHWFFALHENGAAVPELNSLYFEYDSITEENLKKLMVKFPEATELLEFLLTHYGKLRALIYKPLFTLTYNDFYWTNFVVRKDKQAAMMFDYNLLGKGYKFSDFRNVCCSISDESRSAFSDEYNRLFFEKHGYTHMSEEKEEERIDDVAGPVFALMVAFLEKENFPDWAEEQKNEAMNGVLLSKAKQLLCASGGKNEN